MTHPKLLLLPTILTLHLLTMSNTQCPVPFCQKCLNSTHCALCPNHTRLTFALTCEPCTDPACHQCNAHADICNHAEQGNGVVGYKTVPCAVPGCSTCNNNASQCQICNPGHALVNSTACVLCLIGGCVSCPTDLLVCERCQGSKYLANPTSCQSNNVSNCIYSSNYGRCDQCINGKGFFLYWCVNCQVDYCQKCHSNVNSCQLCEEMFGVAVVSGSVECIRCVDPRCVLCGQDANICTMCAYQQLYGPDSSGRCSVCTNTNCKICHKGVDICQLCIPPYGVDANNYCTLCTNPNCYNCTKDVDICHECKSGSGFNGSNNCQPCDDAQCLQCFNDTSICTQCKPGYMFIIDQVDCGVCLVSNCIQCLGNASQCQMCQQGYGLLGNDSCPPCSSSDINCLNCLADNVTVCTECGSGYYLDPSTSTCTICPAFCLLCNYNNLTFTPYCIQCADNTTDSFYVIQSGLCIEVRCGDLIVHSSQQCDNPLGRLHDGCTDMCTFQDGFECVAYFSSTGDLCCYVEPLQMQLVKFDRETDQNGQPLNYFEIQVKIFPPLWIIKHIWLNFQIQKIFTITSQALNVTSLTYNPDTGLLTFTGSITQTILSSTPIEITFLPQAYNFYSLQKTPNSTLVLGGRSFYVLTDADRTMAKIVLYVCYGIVALGWIGWALGVYGRRLAGIEGMVVVQILYMAFLLFPVELLYIQQRVYALKYINGYNHNFLNEQQQANPQLTISHNEIFKFSKNIFLNNFNLCMTIQLLSLIYIAISSIRIRKFFLNTSYKQLERQLQLLQYVDPSKQSQQDNMQIKFDKLIFHQELSLQILMSSSLIVLMYFLMCFALFLKFMDMQKLEKSTAIVCFVVIAIEAIIILGTFIKFCYDPAPFDYFRFSFCQKQLAMRHYCIFILYLAAVALTMPLVSLVYIPLIFPCVMLFETIINRPYKQGWQNVRSCWCILLSILVLFYRVYMKYIVKQQEILSTTPMILFMLILGLVLLTLILSIVSTIHSIYKSHKQTEQKHKEAKNKQAKLFNYRRKLLSELVRIDPNRKTEDINKSNTFREFIKPQVSMLKAANFLREVSCGQDGVEGVFGDIQEFRKLERENIANNQFEQGPLKRRFNQQGLNPKLNLKSTYKQIIKQQLLKQNKNPSPSSIIHYVLPQTINPKQLKLTHSQLQLSPERTPQRSLSPPAKPSHPTHQQPPTLTQSDRNCIATRILHDQQYFINLQAAINVTYQIIEEEIQPELIEEYEKIDVGAKRAEGEGNGNGKSINQEKVEKCQQQETK